MIAGTPIPGRRRPGITLTEILIAIMILGVGMVAVATLFPLGLLRLRDAARNSRSAYITQSAASELESRGLLNKQSFFFADTINVRNGLPTWYLSPALLSNVNAETPFYDPFTQDTAYYGEDPFNAPNPPGPGVAAGTGLGLPIAYDPLWRWQTGVYLDTVNMSTPESRFGYGLGFIRNDPSDQGPPSAHGLQRLTNFNRPAVMPVANAVPGIFVSPEDVVWQEGTNQRYFMPVGNQAAPVPVGTPSPVVPDMSLFRANNGVPLVQTDWHFSWMFTGQQTSAPFTFGTAPTSNASLGVTFDGNIVIFENRPFGLAVAPNLNTPFPVAAPFQAYQAEGETVVEAVWGYSTNVVIPQGYNFGYAAGADRAVLLRWPATTADPVVRVGDWIADVTYERARATMLTRFLGGFGSGAGGLPNPTNNLEWDNLPAQRCFWYQVQRVVPPINATPFATDPNIPYRSMVVYLNSSVQARTVLDGNGEPVVLNAALICPFVVNVIPQTITVR
jgi:hypothetical protein